MRRAEVAQATKRASAAYSVERFLQADFPGQVYVITKADLFEGVVEYYAWANGQQLGKPCANADEAKALCETHALEVARR